MMIVLVIKGGGEGKFTQNEDNNDDIMYQQCDYDKKRKWRDDSKYNRDQYEECESKRYS